jgi:dCMP deaminase
MPRIPINKIYMQIAYQIAKLSYAERRKVGCIIVKDGQIISVGYNGTPHGFENECEDSELITVNASYKETPEIVLDLEKDGFTCKDECCTKRVYTTKKEVLHAESNAISKLAKSTISSVGTTLYTTTMPCFDCSKLIIQAGIVEVHYCEDYRDTSGVDLLVKAGITVYQDIVWNNE